jgi:hypothetical protein
MIPTSRARRRLNRWMRATTIRFTPELWSLLERESRREGVSVAQYVRDAALFRAAYGLGERTAPGDEALEAAREQVASRPFSDRRRTR